MTDWFFTHLVELSLQANWYHVTQAFPPYSHGWVLVWPASALNCDLPSRVDIGYLPEIEGKGQPSLWTRSNSLLDTLDRSIMTNLWEWGLKELQPYSALWWLPCCCFLLWLWAVKFQDYPLEQRWGLGRGQVKILQSSLFLLKFSAIYFSVDTPWIAASLWLISRVVKESILIILPFSLLLWRRKILEVLILSFTNVIPSAYFSEWRFVGTQPFSSVHISSRAAFPWQWKGG